MWTRINSFSSANIQTSTHHKYSTTPPHIQPNVASYMIMFQSAASEQISFPGGSAGPGMTFNSRNSATKIPFFRMLLVQARCSARACFLQVFAVLLPRPEHMGRAGKGTVGIRVVSLAVQFAF